MVICSSCKREVHQDGDMEVSNGWQHCEQQTPICEGATAKWPEVDEIVGSYCGCDGPAPDPSPRPTSTITRPNARPFPIGSLLALTSPFAEGLRRQRFGRSLQDIGEIVAAGGIRSAPPPFGDLNDESRRRPTLAPLPPARELTAADRLALARAEEKRARKRLKRSRDMAKGRDRQLERMEEAAQLRLVKEGDDRI